MSELREAIEKILLPTAESIAGEWGSGETGAEALEYFDRGEINAILDAVIAALPKEKQIVFALSHDVTDEIHKLQFHRYGGYDFAIREMEEILNAAKEGK